MTIIGVVVYLIVGLWFAKFWANYFNSKFKGQTTKREVVTDSWADGSPRKTEMIDVSKNWGDSFSSSMAVVLSLPAWPLVLAYVLILRWPLKWSGQAISAAYRGYSHSAEYLAKELVNPKENVKELS